MYVVESCDVGRAEANQAKTMAWGKEKAVLWLVVNSDDSWRDEAVVATH